MMHHILKDLNPYGEYAPQKIRDAIKNISNSLDILIHLLDKTEKSLEFIDYKLIHKYINEGEESYENWLSQNIMDLILYGGEVLIYEGYGIGWNMQLDEDSETWIPYIIDNRNNSQNDIYIDFHKALTAYTEEGYPTLSQGYRIGR